MVAEREDERVEEVVAVVVVEEEGRLEEGFDMPRLTLTDGVADWRRGEGWTFPMTNPNTAMVSVASGCFALLLFPVEVMYLDFVEVVAVFEVVVLLAVLLAALLTILKLAPLLPNCLLISLLN